MEKQISRFSKTAAIVPLLMFSRAGVISVFIS
jgi:hypothetical protein